MSNYVLLAQVLVVPVAAATLFVVVVFVDYGKSSVIDLTVSTMIPNLA